MQAVRIYSQDKGMEFDIGKMYHANNEKREKTNNRRNRITKSRKTECLEKRKLEYIRSGHHQTSGNERKK